MRRFLVTGMGRSGTMWLAGVLDTAPGWTVKHEPVGRADMEAELPAIQHRFDLAPLRYGEVNSYLRYRAGELKVDALGVLLRDPADVWTSIANRKPEETWPRHLDDYERAIAELAKLVKQGAMAIDFHRAIREPEYVQRVADVLMGSKWRIPDGLFNRAQNATTTRRYADLAEFPGAVRRRVGALQDAVTMMLAGEAARAAAK